MQQSTIFDQTIKVAIVFIDKWCGVSADNTETRQVTRRHFIFAFGNAFVFSHIASNAKEEVWLINDGYRNFTFYRICYHLIAFFFSLKSWQPNRKYGPNIVVSFSLCVTTLNGKNHCLCNLCTYFSSVTVYEY